MGYEYELAGYRVAMRIAADGTAVLTSRNGLDLTAEFAELTGVLTAALRGRAAPDHGRGNARKALIPAIRDTSKTISP